MEKEKILEKIKSKPTWSVNNVLQFISDWDCGETDQKTYRITEKVLHKKHVDRIKPGDVLIIQTLGLVHPTLVWKVQKNKVYGIIITSDKSHGGCLEEIKKDRILCGSYLTITVSVYDLEFAKKHFSFKFENREEFRFLIKRLKEFYK